jgi:hypothetical protein
MLDAVDHSDLGQRQVGDQPHRLGRDQGLDRRRWAVAEHPALVDHDHPAGEGVSLGQVVGGEQDRLAECCEAADLLPERPPGLDVKRHRWLVQEEKIGVADDRECE